MDNYVLIKVSTGQNYYTNIPIDIGDFIVVESKRGDVWRCKVLDIIKHIDYNPFNDINGIAHATCHVLENATKKIFFKESDIMFGCKVVEVESINGKFYKNLFYTDLPVEKGNIVVYELRDGTMHVGRISDTNPDSAIASTFIVDIVDTTANEARKERTKQANKLKAQLDEKRKQFQDIQILELIAKSEYLETAQMLSAYKELTNVSNVAIIPTSKK